MSDDDVYTAHLTGPVDLAMLDAIQDALLESRIRGCDLRLLINSPGGDSAVALAAANFMSCHRRQITAEIHRALSAAAVIALAADCRQMVSNGWLMLHPVTRVASGNAAELRAAAEHADDLDEGMADLLASATRLSTSAARDLIDKARWLDANEAYGLGLVDSVLPAINPAPGGPPADVARQRDADRVAALAGNAEPPTDPAYTNMVATAADLVPAVAPEVRFDVPAEVRDDHIGAFVTLSTRRRRMLRLAHEKAASEHRRGRRYRPAPAAWECELCGALNYHSPGDGLNPAPCSTCREAGINTKTE